MTERIAAADKDVRAEARILTERLGFTFEGYTASGHLRFTRPGLDDEIRLSTTPSTFGWIRTHRQRVARALGVSRRELEHQIAGDRRPGTGHKTRAPKHREVRGVCPTGKVGYESRAKARKAGIKMRSTPARRPYLCEGCGLWHLTKQQRRPDKRQVAAVPTPLAPARPPAPAPIVLRTPAEVRARITTLTNEARAVSRQRTDPSERPPQLDQLRAQIDDLQAQLRRMTLEEAA